MITNKADLVRCGLVVYVDAARMTVYHTGLSFASLEVFIKNVRVGFSKLFEGRKPSQAFTIIVHL